MRDVPLPQNEPIVACRSLCKSYGDFHALKNCNLEVRRGDVFGLLGPNGAGKTTLIRSLLGFLSITRGEARVCGQDPRIDSVAVRQNVSYLPGDARLPTHMRADGVLKFFSEIHPLGDYQRSRSIADRLELDTRRIVGLMSTGMRQKLALSVVLGPRTPLLVLDEPTANLDPSIRASVMDMVTDAHREGRTVVFSSHVLSEIEETCNRVAFLRQGELVHELKMSELFQRHRIHARCASERFDDSGQWIENVPEPFVERVSIARSSESSGEPRASLRIDTMGDLGPMLGWIGSLGLEQIRIEPLGLRAIYNSVHNDQLDEVSESNMPLQAEASA